MKTRKVKTGTLIGGIIATFIVSAFMGVVAGARGLGSLYPQLNLVAGPFVCPDGHMTYTQHTSQGGAATAWAATWFCVDERTGVTTALTPAAVFLAASPLYTVVIFAGLLLSIYGYWHSPVGPAKNDGLHLW